MSKEDTKPQHANIFLTWPQINSHLPTWHWQSIEYLSRIWPNIRDRQATNTLWGDELECQIVEFNHETHESYISPRQQELLNSLPKNGMFQPEFAQYMIESVPATPYDYSLSSLSRIETKISLRRRMIEEHLELNVKAMSLSMFPLLGVGSCVGTEAQINNTAALDSLVSEGVYSSVRANIEARSQRQRDITVLVYQDENTTAPRELHLEHMIYGPGGCGLQATFSCASLHEAKELHDQLAVLGPMFLALSAATPVYRGLLVDTDVRWNQNSCALDDRRKDEILHLDKRWGMISEYLSPGFQISDQPGEGQPKALPTRYAQHLEMKGMDRIMAKYFAQLHLRDPLCVSTMTGVPADVAPEALHKSMYCSIWPHVRLKLPDVNDMSTGWRVEFRPMEVQLTDFGNAAFLVFLALLRQVLGSESGRHVDLRMPLELVRENMQRAHVRDAVLVQKFWFPQDETPVEMTLDEIVNGSGSRFQGLLPMLETYVSSSQHRDPEQGQLEQLQRYLNHISHIANGAVPTTARWMRDYIRNHDGYLQDSVVSTRICYDMLMAVRQLS